MALAANSLYTTVSDVYESEWLGAHDMAQCVQVILNFNYFVFYMTKNLK